jgi:hypothetical protein
MKIGVNTLVSPNPAEKVSQAHKSTAREIDKKGLVQTTVE